MIDDAATIPRDTRLDTDVCVVGGGMSGLAIALRLQGRGLRVTVLEAGAETPDDDVRDLADGSSVGLPYFPLREARPRLLGGSTNYWAGWCRPIDPFDLDLRSWIPHSGWPIDWGDLEPYFAPALELCEIPGVRFDAAAWDSVTPDLYRAPYAAGALKATVWVGSPPTKFGKTYRDRLAEAEDVRVLLRANVTELVADHAGAAVESVRVRTLEGNAFEVRSRVVVLAAGAMETPRLLLHSRQGERRGLGNEHDVVGRYFMEHPHVVTGRVELFDRGGASSGGSGGPPDGGGGGDRGGARRAEVPALDRRFLAGAKARLAMERPQKGVKFAYTLREEVLRERELLNWSAHVRTVADARGGPEVYHAMKLMVGNLRSLRTFARQVRRGSLPRGVAKQLRVLGAHPDDVVRILYQQLVRRPRALEVYTQSEQAPNRSSRVMLADDRDALGVPRVQLDWRLSDIDKASIHAAQRLLSEQLEASGVGRIRDEPWLGDPEGGWGASLQGGYHHLGTARMGSDPRTSVVDGRCRVHSVRNLYVGDTSVVPTGGYANPLLTGLALALRTADTVHSELTRDAGAVG